MPQNINIVQISRNELVIEPMRKNTWSHDNSIELAELKVQLKKVELIEGEDYSVEKSSSSYHYTLKFQSKSSVVRALWTIPDDMIEAMPYPMSRGAYNQAKLTYATSLTKKECTVHDEQFRQKAFNEFYIYIKGEISKIHAPEAKPTTVMQQLDKDLLFIDTTVAEDVWTRPRSHLALASLVKAYKDEEQKPTLVKSGFSLFKKESLLLPQYKAIIHTICQIQGSDFEQLCATLIPDYNLYVVAKQKEMALKVATAASVSVDAKIVSLGKKV